YTPDGNPLIGPAFGLRNFYLCEGFSFGITAAGGAGKVLAEWIVGGEPSIDLLAVDSRRFGAYANKRYAELKNVEAYENVFTIHYPDEERPAARPAKTSAIYDRQKVLNATFGQRYGWERPNWFAPEGIVPQNKYSFHTRHTNWFEVVGAECRAVRERVGLLDLTPFSKHTVSGPGAAAFLDGIVANRLPRKTGGIVLAHALTKAGEVESEFTITRTGDDSFYLVSAGAAERIDHDVLLRSLPDDGSVMLENLTKERGTLVVCGPQSRNLLSKLTGTNLSNANFRWLTSQPIAVAGIRMLGMRVNFVGELGWELHHPIDRQVELFDALCDAGQEFGMVHFGMYAMESMRIEKSYRMIGMDLAREYSLLEAGLPRFINFDKEFPGKDALLKQQEQGLPLNYVTLEVDVTDADPLGSEPIFHNGTMIGRGTSGAYGHTVEKSLSLGYVPPEFATVGTELEVEILGERRPARVIPESPCDPENLKLRA
ncbi:MAG: FAD-dependent oxidoreductase, partial [SAR324 cluster bacterium]|nr:FAD-dependent oxidoreductase [SAR324 cluster bacterium]